METKETERNIVLRADAPGDEERVRAILASWGLEENSIYRLLTADRAALPTQPTVVRKQPDETVTLLHGGVLPRVSHASH